MAERPQTLAIIGCGFMGSAILEGLLLQPPTSSTPPLSYTAHVNTPISLSRLQEAFSSHPSNSITFTCGDSQLPQAISSAEIILLGFLPGDLNRILSTASLASLLQGKLIISMLAGISTAQLLQALQTHSPGSTPQDFRTLARIIPTLSAKIGESVTLLADVPNPSSASAETLSVVEGIFSRIGSVHYMPEKFMDAATAIGAAMHALAIVAVDGATDASVAEGIPHATALSLTAHCLRSCTSLMLPSSSSSGGGGMSPEAVKSAMSTPSGITINSLLQLDERQVRAGIAGTVRGAVEYTKRMNE